MGWKDALQGAASGAVENKINEHLPMIQQLFREKVGGPLRDHLNDPAKLVSTSKVVHGLLPMPVRLFVKEEAFVNFCVAHKDKLVG